MEDRIGQQFGNYRLIRLLGKGGTAEVYLGEHIYLDTRAAIKVLHTQLASDDVEGFRSEARTVAHLTHPHIVRVLEFGVEDTSPFLVMEYAPHGTMRTRYPKGSRLPLETIVAYVKQVADALYYIHEQKKLVHRDVKPENMLLRTDQDLLLSDFGIVVAAHTTGSLILEGQAGTLPYMAPEQILKMPRPTSDQYALGIVVYEWLCGKRPFDELEGSIINRHLYTPPPALREHLLTISLAVENVVLKALAKNPKERFASVQAFAAALEQASRLEPSHPAVPLFEFPKPSQPSLPADAIVAISSSQTSHPTSVVTSPSQSLEPANMVIPPIQSEQLTDEIALFSASAASSLSAREAAPLEAPQVVQPTARSISRRAVILSLMGLTGVSLVGSSVAWLARSQSSRVSSPSFRPTGTKKADSTTVATPLSLYIASGTLLSKLDAETRAVHWSYETGHDFNQEAINSTPIMVDRVVCFTAQNNYLYALDASNGSLRWRFKTNDSAELGAPTGVDGVIYFGATNGYVYMVNAADGSLHQRYRVGANGAPGASLVNGVMYIALFDDTRHNSYLLALDAKSGSQLWRNSTALGGQVVSGLQVMNDVIYLNSTRSANGTLDDTTNYIYAFNAKDGSMLWRSSRIDNAIVNPPTAANGAVYFGSQNGYAYALDVGTGKTLWRYNAGGAVYPTPVVVNSVVYIGVAVPDSGGGFSGNGFIAALNANGSERWRHVLRGYYSGAPLVVSNGTIYVSLASSMVYALRATDGSEFQQYKAGNGIGPEGPLVTVAP
jgi:serine/threonine protein kinase/outer membrane protein assembly factor BamB